MDAGVVQEGEETGPGAGEGPPIAAAAPFLDGGVPPDSCAGPRCDAEQGRGARIFWRASGPLPDARSSRQIPVGADVVLERHVAAAEGGPLDGFRDGSIRSMRKCRKPSRAGSQHTRYHRGGRISMACGFHLARRLPPGRGAVAEAQAPAPQERGLERAQEVAVDRPQIGQVLAACDSRPTCRQSRNRRRSRTLSAGRDLSIFANPASARPEKGRLPAARMAATPTRSAKDLRHRQPRRHLHRGGVQPQAARRGPAPSG